MIKILRKGTRQKLACDGCGCYFSFETEDTRLINEHYCVNCPQCDRVLELPGKKEDGLQPGFMLLNNVDDDVKNDSESVPDSEYRARSDIEMGDF